MTKFLMNFFDGDEKALKKAIKEAEEINEDISWYPDLTEEQHNRIIKDNFQGELTSAQRNLLKLEGWTVQQIEQYERELKGAKQNDKT